MKASAKLLFLMAFLLGSVGLYAQKIEFCGEYTESGKAVDPGTTWTIGPDGGWVYILYSQDAKIVGDLTFKIYLKEGEEYEFIKTVSVEGTSGKRWGVAKNTFKETGKYKVIAYIDGEKSATEYVTFDPKEKKKEDNLFDSDDPSSTFYYMSSKVKFCEDASSGYCEGESSSFTISKSGSYLYVYLEHAKKLATTQLTVKVYKKVDGNYDDLVETKYFDIEKDWKSTYFKYTFYKKGEYKVRIETKDGVWIQDGFVTINYK